MARTTVANTIQRIRRQLTSAYRWETNALQSALEVGDVQVDLALAHKNSVRVGSILNIGTELMRVVDAAPSSNLVTVVRGWLDSTATTHSAGAEVLVNPRFSTQDIFEAMIDEIDSWQPSLFKTVTVETTIGAGEETVELPASLRNLIGLTSVRASASSFATSGYSWPTIEVRLQRHDTDWSQATTSGIRMRIITPLASGNIVYTALVPFDVSTLAITDDLVTDIGLSSTMLDVLSLGVRVRLAAEDELARLQTHMQEQPQRAADRPAAAGVQPWQALQRMYDMRKTQERVRLTTLYPIAFQP